MSVWLEFHPAADRASSRSIRWATAIAIDKKSGKRQQYFREIAARCPDSIEPECLALTSTGELRRIIDFHEPEVLQFG